MIDVQFGNGMPLKEGWRRAFQETMAQLIQEAVMKDQVIVNGVTLTRAQVEGALKELNAPQRRTPQGGDRFLYGGHEHVVLEDERAAVIYKALWSYVPSGPFVVGMRLKDGKLNGWSSTALDLLTFTPAPAGQTPPA